MPGNACWCVVFLVAMAGERGVVTVTVLPIGCLGDEVSMASTADASAPATWW